MRESETVVPLLTSAVARAPPLAPAASTFRHSQTVKVWTMLATTEVRIVTQDQEGPHHQKLHVGGARYISGILPFEEKPCGFRLSRGVCVGGGGFSNPPKKILGDPKDPTIFLPRPTP